MSGKKFTPSKLIAAIQSGDPDAVSRALDGGADIEEADMHGMAGLPLRTACFSGDQAVVRELVKRGANINAPGSDGPGMPLRLALRCRHQAIVELLISLGADTAAGMETPPDAAPVERVAPEGPAPQLSTEIPTEPAATLLPLTEDIDAQPSYGTDTSLLTMDLLLFNENDSPPTPSRKHNDQTKTEGEKTSFWETGSNFR